jgi:hypothetical protein
LPSLWCLSGITNHQGEETRITPTLASPYETMGVGVEEIMVITNHVTEVVINDHVTQGSICHKV